MEDGINDFNTRWVVTAGILCFLPDGMMSYLSVKNRVGSDVIVFAMVLMFYKCCRLFFDHDVLNRQHAP